MNGEPPSKDDVGGTPEGSLTPKAPPINTSPASEPTTAQQLTNVEERMSGFERSTLGLGRYGLAVTILTGAFIALQWWEMHSGATDTHTLAESAKSTAETARLQVEASGAQTKALQDQVDAIKRQMREDQRARLDIQFGTISWVENRSLQVQMTLVNKGKTPATHISGHGFVEKILIHHRIHFGEYEQQFGTGLLPSNVPVGNWGFQSAHHGVPVPMSETDVGDLNEGRAIAVVHGVVNYADIFGVKHWERFCSYSAANAFVAASAVQDTAKPCTDYSGADEN
jgi:hypothetical protein